MIVISRRHWVLLAVAVAACTRGSRTPGETAPVAATQEVAAPPGDAWTQGVLPASMMEGTPRRGGTLVVRVQVEPASLNRITDSDATMVWMLQRKVYETLAKLDQDKAPDYPLTPLLAESWTVAPDGLTVTFKIRRGVRWHDGEPFTGQDVVATVRKILDPKVRSMHLRSNFDELESIDVVPGDDFTVVSKWKHPYFKALRALATTLIYPKHVLDVAGDMLGHPIQRAPIGTGPFKFEDWKTGDHVSFVRNEDYWGRAAYLDRVTYRFVPDPVVGFRMLENGAFDVYLTVQATQWAREMPKSEFLRTHFSRSRFYSANYSWIGWNTDRPVFSDARVRRAMTMLIDRESVRRAFLLGVDRPTTCIFWSEGPNCDPTLKPLPYDPKGADRLLDEAGWTDHDGDGWRDRDGQPFEFTFLTPASSLFLGKLTPYLQREFDKHGIRMSIRKVEWALFLQLLREHRFDACSLVWAENDVVGDPYAVWHSSQKTGGNNYISYASPEADRLIEQARIELDDDKRAVLYRQLGRILHVENPYTILYTRPDLDVLRNTVRGLKPGIAWWDFENAWLEPE